MKILKFLLLWLTLAIVMLFTWSFGFVAGNMITNTSPPTAGDPILALYFFMGVCVFNSFLLSVILWLTRIYSGMGRIIWLVSFAFVIQFLLPQMDSFFFRHSIGMQNLQIASIIIAGFIMSTVTVVIGVTIVSKMSTDPKQPFSLGVSDWRSFVVPFLLLACIVYPIIYLTFGYYVAWQNENLRIFYSKSSEMISFIQSVSGSFVDGLYFFQILRAAIWVIVTLPLTIMIRYVKGFYLLVGLFSSLMPALQLFIPNPYMPQDIAMSHFVETATSNFIWGVVIAYAVDRFLNAGQPNDVPSALGKSTG